MMIINMDGFGYRPFFLREGLAYFKMIPAYFICGVCVSAAWLGSKSSGSKLACPRFRNVIQWKLLLMVEKKVLLLYLARMGKAMWCSTLVKVAPSWLLKMCCSFSWICWIFLLHTRRLITISALQFPLRPSGNSPGLMSTSESHSQPYSLPLNHCVLNTKQVGYL